MVRGACLSQLGDTHMTTKTQFEIETGWSEADACAMAKEVSRENRLFGHHNRNSRRGSRCRNNTTPSTFSVAEFERQTGWSWGDAVDMAAELQRERRIFGNPHSRRNRNRRHGRPVNAAAFKRATGWSIEDAANEAKRARRDHRLFGPAMYASN